MLQHFLKYQTLGNNFIVFDWYKKSEPAVSCALADSGWSDFVKKSCNRYTGVGADGVLIIKHDQESFLPEMLIFNADGTSAENCLNGLRCVAHYLVMHYHYPSQFSIKLGKQIVTCLVDKTLEITTYISGVECFGSLKLKTEFGVFDGYQASAGNPHFIVFQEVSRDWLEQHGMQLECHSAFPEKTNVEFLWPSKQNDQILKVYKVLIHERGCGMTQACGSGASAIIATLFHNQHLKKEEKVMLVMPGGSVIGWIDAQGLVALQASANFVFKGEF